MCMCACVLDDEDYEGEEDESDDEEGEGADGLRAALLRAIKRGERDVIMENADGTTHTHTRTHTQPMNRDEQLQQRRRQV